MIISVTPSHPNDRYLFTFQYCGDGLKIYLFCVNVYYKSRSLLLWSVDFERAVQRQLDDNARATGNRNS